MLLTYSLGLSHFMLCYFRVFHHELSLAFPSFLLCYFFGAPLHLDCCWASFSSGFCFASCLRCTQAVFESDCKSPDIRGAMEGAAPSCFCPFDVKRISSDGACPVESSIAGTAHRNHSFRTQKLHDIAPWISDHVCAFRLLRTLQGAPPLAFCRATSVVSSQANRHAPHEQFPNS